MGWVVGIIIGLMLLAAMSGPVDPASVLPPATTVAPNPGGGHCGYGPNDDDVRGIVHATATTEPHC